jgi:hypothetical protein
MHELRSEARRPEFEKIAGSADVRITKAFSGGINNDRIDRT